MSPPEPDAIAYMLAAAVRGKDENKPRSKQKAAGLLGMSEVGWCRAAALLTMEGTQDTDSTPLWAAVVGTSVGDTVEAALHDAFGHWLIQHRTVATLKNCMSGPVQVPGTADIIVPDWNCALDNKTKSGLELARRYPWSANYDFQTWLQVLGCVQDGTLDPDKPLYHGLAYWDRSGGEALPHVVMKEWDPGKENEITAWLDDVIQARLHDPNNLDPLRDLPAPVCEKVCGFFGRCRGALPADDMVQLTDPELVEAVEMAAEAKALKKQADKMTADARAVLRGVSGVTPEWSVRWTETAANLTPGSERAGYGKMEVYRTRRRA